MNSDGLEWIVSESLLLLWWNIAVMVINAFRPPERSAIQDVSSDVSSPIMVIKLLKGHPASRQVFSLRCVLPPPLSDLCQESQTKPSIAAVMMIRFS